MFEYLDATLSYTFGKESAKKVFSKTHKAMFFSYSIRAKLIVFGTMSYNALLFPMTSYNALLFPNAFLFPLQHF